MWMTSAKTVITEPTGTVLNWEIVQSHQQLAGAWLQSLSLSEAEILDLSLFITHHLSHKRGDSCIPGLNNWVTRFLCVSGSALPTPPLPQASAPLFLFCGALWAGRACVTGEAGRKVKPGNGTLCLRMQSKVIAELEMESQNSDSKSGTERT